MKITIITNIPTPYRDPVYQKLAKFKEVELLVLFCSPSEPNRQWEIGSLNFSYKFLNTKTNTYRHFNWNIINELRNIKPDVVITSGINPTMLFAWIWSVLKRKKHISFSDANKHSESDLGYFHKLTRKMVFNTSSAFIGASDKTLDLFKIYNVDESKFFKSCLAIDNESFRPKKAVNKKYDLLFCGQFNDRKNPLFFVEIAKAINEIIPGTRVLLIGNGPQKLQAIEKLKDYKIMYDDVGFVQPYDIIQYYQMSKLFIFPSKKDPWGLVANEALAAGLPVLVSSRVGVADELVIDDYNGFVFSDFNLNSWVSKTKLLLEDYNLYCRLSSNAKESVKVYTHEAGATGIYKAVIFALSEK